MTQDWLQPGFEPSIDEMMSDPLVQAIMRRDGLSVEQVRGVVERARSARHPNRERVEPPLPRTSEEMGSYSHQSAMCKLSRLCQGNLPLAGSLTAVIVLLAVAILVST